MAKNCFACIYYELCQDEMFPSDELECSTCNETGSECDNFVDFDFIIDYPERSEGEHYWLEMSFHKYSNEHTKWNLVPTEWELELELS